MSTAAKLTLAGTACGAFGIIVFVHYAQRAEKAVCYHSVTTIFIFSIMTADPLQAMHAGVIRDMEQQRLKKERQADFEMQRALEQEYRKVQPVHDGGAAEGGGT